MRNQKKCALFFAGGTVGLFTGMSILGLFDMVYWAVKILVVFLRHLLNLKISKQ